MVSLKNFAPPLLAIATVATFPAQSLAVSFFDTQGSFDITATGLTFVGTEDFESTSLAPDSLDSLLGPIEPGVPATFSPPELQRV